MIANRVFGLTLHKLLEVLSHTYLEVYEECSIFCLFLKTMAFCPESSITCWRNLFADTCLFLCFPGIVLLESFKELLKEASVDTNIFDRLALLSDSDAGFTNSGSDSEMVRNEDQQMPIGVKRK